MQKIDRLGWTAGMCFESFGLRIGVRAKQKDDLEQLVPLLPPGWKPARSRLVDRTYSVVIAGTPARANLRLYHLLYSEAARIARTMKVEELCDAFERDLTIYVAEFAKQRVFIHAGVVGWQGRAILIPGRSLSGKTTLVRALLKAGAEYYSDEYAVLDERGHVHPYARPLGIRENGSLRGTKHAPEIFGAAVGRKPLPVGLVVATAYKQGAKWRPREATPGRAILTLIENAVPARRNPRGVLSRLAKALKQAKAIQGTRGEAEEVVPDLLCR